MIDTNEITPVYADDGKCIGQVMPTAKPEALGYGIQDWSHDKLPLAIVSAYTADCTEFENRQKTVELLSRFAGCGIAFGIVQGCYKGQREQSVLVELRDALDWQRVLQAAAAFKQESVLYIDSDRIASLYYVDPFRESQRLGKLVPVSAQQAERLGNWTRTSNGQYYAVL